jgi:hypothetical protein
MQFQVKDLIIVVPDEGGEQLAGCTVSCTPYGCTRLDSKKCDPGTCKITVCNAPTKLPTQPVLEYSDQLALLKDQLQLQMIMLEQQESLLRQQMGPQSVAEVEKVEKALRGALDELGARKKTLQATAPKKTASAKPRKG